MSEEFVQDDEIVENYSLDGVYEQIQIFSEISPNLITKIRNVPFLEAVKKYFSCLTT